MTRQQSEGEVHVEAMRLILAEMERREDVPDWTIWQHMLNMLETIFQGIEDQRDDDRDELMHTRKDRDHWRQARQEAIEAGELMRAEIETLRQQLKAAQAAVTLQRAGIERLAAFVWKVRTAILRYQPWCEALNQITAALAELDASNTEPAPVAEPAPCPECGRLQAFVGMVRELLAIPLAQISYDDMSAVRAELAALDAEPTPVAEPLDAEGGA